MNVSIVIPSHNAARWIEQTLESVRDQTYPREEFELLVVDDGSTDASPSIAAERIRRYALNGRVITLNPNRGVSAARNVGWQAASGEWIQFVDSDDLLAPGKLELQVAAARQATSDVAVLYSDWQPFLFSDTDWQPSGSVMRSTIDVDPIVQILDDFAFGYVGPTLVRRTWLESTGGFDTRMSLGEDIDLMLRLAMAGGGFRRVASDTPLFYYRDTPDSLWRKSVRNIQAVDNLLRSFRRAESHLRARPGEGLSEQARIALARRYADRLDVLNECDGRAFDEVVGWISDLQLRGCPPDARRGTRVAAGLIGYSNALRLRSAMRLNLRRARTLLAGGASA